MQINELRVGNKVGSGNEIITVNEIIESGINPKWGIHDDNPYDEISFDLIYGIPLTEEWLLKFGFEKDNSYDYRKGFICWQKEPTDYGTALIKKCNWFIECGGDDQYYHVPVYYLQYVHQLQNLYFSLTGEELQLKQ